MARHHTGSHHPAPVSPASERSRSRRGQAIVELLIALPVLALLLFGILEMGLAWRTSHVLTQAAREGSRLAALPTTTEDQVRTAINDRLASGGLAPGSAAVSFSCANACFAASRPAGTRIETRVSYPVAFVVLGPIVDYVTGNGAAYQPRTLESAFVMRSE